MPKVTAKAAALASGVLMSLIGTSNFTWAAETTFDRPMYQGNRLDWCVTWAQNCGKPAADAYCRHQGFTHATRFEQAPNIGGRRSTRLIGTGAICDQPMCDGFRFITCAKPSEPVMYERPMFQDMRLDWCLTWAANCGKPAADAFCRHRGHTRATDFAQAANIGGRRSTRLIGTGAICDQPACDGFRFIRCE